MSSETSQATYPTRPEPGAEKVPVYYVAIAQRRDGSYYPTTYTLPERVSQSRVTDGNLGRVGRVPAPSALEAWRNVLRVRPDFHELRPIGDLARQVAGEHGDAPVIRHRAMWSDPNKTVSPVVLVPQSQIDAGAWRPGDRAEAAS